MVKRVCMGLLVMCAVSFVFTAAVYAQRGPRFRHADRDNDGVLDRKEIRLEKLWENKQGSKVNSWWENRADTDNDGRVESDELAAWKKLEKERIDINNDGVIDAKEQRLCWRHARSKVNTSLEGQYDANSDGWLDSDEVRELLKDRHELIITNGQAKVDTAIEEEYDTNDDGILDVSEAQAMGEDMQL